MNNPEQNWRWGTPEGSQELDRIMDARLSFREKIQWVEETETLHERLAKKSDRCFDKDKDYRDPLCGY